MRKPKPSLEENPEGWVAASLVSKDESEREQAKKTLERMGPAGVEIVLNLMRKESDKRRKARRCFFWGVGIYAGIVLLVVSIWAMHGLITGHWGHFPGEIFKVMSYTGTMVGVLAMSSAQKAGTEWLAQYDDPRAVGPLLDAMESRDPKLRDIAPPALVRILPKMELAHAELLSPPQRKILRNLLNSERRDLTLAVLRVLSMLSDTAAIPNVQDLIRREERHERPSVDLLAPARRTLSDLEAARELERERETLLRPAESAPGEHLLRPAISTPQADPATLLRSSASD